MRRAAATGLCFLLLASAGPAAAQTRPPPPTPVPPAGSPSPFPSTLETPEPSADPPRLSAPSAALVDLDTGRILFERRAGVRRPVASTTKVMTALLVVESTEPDAVVTIDGTATGQRGAALGLVSGERITVRDLLFALMLQSANDAAIALAEHVAGSVEAFVKLMNRRARAMGLRDTRFASPNGLDDAGFSTARDMAAITAEALRSPLVARVVGARFRTIPAPEGPPRRVQNRNALLWLYPGAIGVKTGWTSAAGFCLVAAAERDGLRLASVVLGAPVEAFSDSAAVLNHGFAAFERRVVVAAGEEVEPTPTGVPVTAVTGSSLEALLRRGQQVVYRVRSLPGASAQTLRAGEQAGTLIASAGGELLGEVPLLAAEDPPVVQTQPPPPWWDRAIRSVADSLAELLATLFF